MASPRFAWGIDVGNRALKAIKLVRDGAGGLRIDDVDVIEHEHILSDAGDNKEALVNHALAVFAQKHPEKGGAVAMGVSGQSSFARFIKLPPVEDKKVPEIVRFEAIQQIPFPLDDVEWSYQIFQDEGSPEKEVGIFAMRKELVNQLIKNFTDAGLNVQTVQMSPLAVYNAVAYDQRIKGTTMIVDVGADNTDLIIAEGEQVWLRSIPVGGNNFTEALIKQFKLKFPKAEELKRNAATSKYTRQILQAMRPVFDTLVSEIQRSIGFYASVHRDSRISRVIVLGGTFRLPGLIKFLQMQLQLDVQRFDTMGAAAPTDARVAALLNDNVLSSVGAYGLAVQAMGEGKITSSLLPTAIRKERMWQEKTKWFAAAAALVVLGTGVQVGRYYYDRMQFAATAEARQTIAEQMEVAQRYDTHWKDVEASGEPERKQIASLQSLTKLRDLQPKILLAIDKALPESGTKPEGKRNERKVVLLDDILPQYIEDLTPAVAKNESGFYTMAAPEFILLANNATSGGGAGFRLAPRSIGAPGVATAAAAADAAATPASKQRGYLLTLTCTTPMTKWTAVAEAVRTALVDQTKPEGQTRQEFRIERVEIVGRTDLKNVPLAERNRANRNNGMRRSGSGFVNNRVRPGATARRGFQPALSDVEEFEDTVPRFRNSRSGQPGYRGPGARPPGPGALRPPAGRPPTGTTPKATTSPDAAAADELLPHDMPQLNFDAANLAAQPVDPNQPPVILDPVTGEDATSDNRLTFLIAVVLDPAPPAPPTPEIPADGGEGPPPPASASATTGNPAVTIARTAAR